MTANQTSSLSAPGSPDDCLLPLRDVFVVRQPIYDLKLNVFAYKLLVDRSAMNQSGAPASDQATADLLCNTFFGLDVDVLGGYKRAFISCTSSFLCQNSMQGLPADRLGIDMQVDGAVDAELVDVIRPLVALGYIIALDGCNDYDNLGPLVELVDIVRLDVHAHTRASVEERVALLRQYEVKLLAERVETQDDFTFCQALGFDYVQGYFCCQPQVVKGR